MPKRRRSRGDDPPPSGERPSLSKMGEWERMWVRRLGLEDIDWDHTTERLTEADRQSRYEAHVERLRREGILEASKATSETSS